MKHGVKYFRAMSIKKHAVHSDACKLLMNQHHICHCAVCYCISATLVKPLSCIVSYCEQTSNDAITSMLPLLLGMSPGEENSTANQGVHSPHMTLSTTCCLGQYITPGLFSHARTHLLRGQVARWCCLLQKKTGDHIVPNSVRLCCQQVELPRIQRKHAVLMEKLR